MSAASLATSVAGSDPDPDVRVVQGDGIVDEAIAEEAGLVELRGRSLWLRLPSATSGSWSCLGAKIVVCVIIWLELRVVQSIEFGAGGVFQVDLLQADVGFDLRRCGLVVAGDDLHRHVEAGLRRC